MRASKSAHRSSFSSGVTLYGHGVARSTVAKVLKANGIPPAPARPSSWRTFLRAHWGEIARADFFTTEVWTPRGLITYDTLFVIDLRSRRVHVVGSTPIPDGGFMAQAARRLTDAVDGFLVATASSSAIVTGSGPTNSDASSKAPGCGSC
jgi:hypothetical protein